MKSLLKLLLAFLLIILYLLDALKHREPFIDEVVDLQGSHIEQYNIDSRYL